MSIRCLISAGPTREYFDPVRFISNPSTGKMGYAIARAAVTMGWTVDLVSGPSPLPEPDGVVFYPVETGEEMFHQIDALFDAADVLIMTAAVTDFKPSEWVPHKVKKEIASRDVSFVPVVDILGTVARRKRPDQCVIGFAAETDDVEAYALGKLRSKNLDYIVANRIGNPDTGFAADTNEIVLLGHDDTRITWGPASKERLGFLLVEHIAALHTGC